MTNKNTFAGQQAQLQRVLCDDEQEEGGVDVRGGSRRPRGYIKHHGLDILILIDRTALFCIVLPHHDPN